MATSLIDAASSVYIEASNTLKGLLIPEVYIYVEGVDDIPFWSELVRPYQGKYKFNILQLRDDGGKPQEGKLKLLQHVSLKCDLDDLFVQ